MWFVVKLVLANRTDSNDKIYSHFITKHRKNNWYYTLFWEIYVCDV